MEKQEAIQRTAWSLAEIAQKTGLSLGYLRNEQRAGRLPIRRFGRRVLVLDDDLRTYLSRGSSEPTALQGAA
jgi:excisionase family DNA binding protein